MRPSKNTIVTALIISAVTVFALYAGITVARADLDSDVLDNYLYYVAPGGKSAARPALVGGVRLDPTLAELNVVRNWDNLRQSTRDTLSRYIEVGDWRNGARSVNSVQSNGCTEVISESDDETMDSTHFRVVYTTSLLSSHRTTTAFVQSLLSIAEYSWNYEVTTLGLPEPVTSHTDGKSRIYVCDLLGGTGGGILGRTWTETLYPDYIAATYIEVDNDYSNVNTYPTTSTEEFVSVIFAHEFFHSIQFAINYQAPTYWLLESNAVWMEDEVYPDVDDYVYQYLGARYQNMDVSIDYFSFSDVLGYGASIFFRDITENVSNPQFVVDLWAQMKTECLNLSNHAWCDQNTSEIPLVDSLLVADGTDVETVYRDFNIANYTKDYVDGSLSYFPDVTTKTLDVSSGTVTETDKLDHLAAKFYEIEYPSGDVTIKPTVKFSGSTSADWRVSVVKDVGGTPVTSNLSLSNGAGELALSGFGSTYNSAALIVNNVHTTADDQSFTLTLDEGAEIETPVSPPPQRTVSASSGASFVTAHSMNLKTNIDAGLKSISYSNTGQGQTGVGITWNLYIDSNGDGLVDSGDTALAQVSGVDLTTITFSGLSASFTSGEEKTLLLGFDIGAQVARTQSAGFVSTDSSKSAVALTTVAGALAAFLLLGMFFFGAEPVRIAKTVFIIIPALVAVTYIAGCGGGGGTTVAAPTEPQVRIAAEPGNITLETSTGDSVLISGSTITGPAIYVNE